MIGVYRGHLGLAALATLLGCQEAVAPVPEPRITVAQLAAGDGQTGLTGSTLQHQVQVRVRVDGVPAAGIPVAWSTTSGLLSPSDGVTDPDGYASATWTLGTVPGQFEALATVAEAVDGSVTFRATVVPLIIVTVDPARDMQVGEVARLLPDRLRVHVTADGEPARGYPVRWTTSGGQLFTSAAGTDGQGDAEASWLLGTTAGSVVATASVDGSGQAVQFTATALAASPTRLGKLSGDLQVVPANHDDFDALRASVSDAYANQADASSVTWAVLSGPVEITSVTRVSGEAIALIGGTGARGVAIVRATLPSASLYVDYTLTLVVEEYFVSLNTLGSEPEWGFRSDQNGTIPAVDTIPAGSRVTWIQRPFDYDAHDLVSDDIPGFQPGVMFPYGSARIEAVFPTPGTYHYRDSFTGYTGTVVVE
jgi:plastocyanin